MSICASSFPPSLSSYSLFFFFNDTATTEIYTLSLHDALPIFLKAARLFLRLLGMHGEVDVEIKIRTNIPEGRGLGSSSADVRATLNALASALGLSVSPELVDFLTVRAEDATNPGTGQPSLFYHRLALPPVRLP